MPCWPQRAVRRATGTLGQAARLHRPGDLRYGQGLLREQAAWAQRGYVVLHTDYRNRAGSDDDPRAERSLRLGYAVDAVNAVLAVPRTYFGRISEPLLIHHGTSDDSVPIRWTRATYDALQREGNDVKLFVYDGEEHAFGPQWPRSMRRTVRFFDRHLGA